MVEFHYYSLASTPPGLCRSYCWSENRLHQSVNNNNSSLLSSCGLCWRPLGIFPWNLRNHVECPDESWNKVANPNVPVILILPCQYLCFSWQWTNTRSNLDLVWCLSKLSWFLRRMIMFHLSVQLVISNQHRLITDYLHQRYIRPWYQSCIHSSKLLSSLLSGSFCQFAWKPLMLSNYTSYPFSCQF